MAETYTPPQEQAPKDDFDEILEMQARDSAQRILEQPVDRELVVPERSEDKAPTQRNFGKRATVATVGAVLVTGAAVGGVAAATAAPEFSEETTTYSVEPGDGLYDVANEIAGINTVDVRDAIDRIQVDPANIDVLKDGLQTGEQIVIPVSVEGYEETK